MIHAKCSLLTAIIITLMMASLANAQSNTETTPPAKAEKQCEVNDRSCLLGALQKEALTIEKPAWQDQTLRELAKTLAFDGDIDKALAIVKQIRSADTKALTLRGIGMTAAHKNKTKAQYDEIFKKLRTSAKEIEHPPSYAIALTYIAMAQAFAGDNEGAWATAKDMKNDALRQKAYAETAEIQAEKGNFDAAMKSIGFVDTETFRNKAYSIVSKIFADKDQLSNALNAAYKIKNSYKKSEAMQYILDKQKPRDSIKDTIKEETN